MTAELVIRLAERFDARYSDRANGSPGIDGADPLIQPSAPGERDRRTVELLAGAVRMWFVSSVSTV